MYKNSRVPDELTGVVDAEVFDKSRRYQLDKSNYGLCHSLYKQIEFLVCEELDMTLMDNMAGYFPQLDIVYCCLSFR